MTCLNSYRHYVTKRAEQLQNDYEISKSPKLAEIIMRQKYWRPTKFDGYL